MLALDAWRARGSTLEWRGHRVFHVVEGEGEPLLLIHGFPTASWDFSGLWPALVERFRVLTLDMIGFGFSTKPRVHDYTIASQADLLEAFLELLGPAPAAFEFRHPSWEDADVVQLLSDRGVTLCVAEDDDGRATELPRTAALGYLRLRSDSYDDAGLASWVARVQTAGWERAFVFFKHEEGGIGVRYARRFLELAGAPRP